MDRNPYEPPRTAPAESVFRPDRRATVIFCLGAAAAAILFCLRTLVRTITFVPSAQSFQQRINFLLLICLLISVVVTLTSGLMLRYGRKN